MKKRPRILLYIRRKKLWIDYQEYLAYKRWEEGRMALMFPDLARFQAGFIKSNEDGKITPKHS